MTNTVTESAATKPRLQQRYQDEIKSALLEQFGYANVM
jgi:large subunit ribosomal protein L5